MQHWTSTRQAVPSSAPLTVQAAMAEATPTVPPKMRDEEIQAILNEMPLFADWMPDKPNEE